MTQFKFSNLYVRFCDIAIGKSNYLFWYDEKYLQEKDAELVFPSSTRPTDYPS